MTDEEIIQNNILIAEFMGLERTDKDYGEITYKGISPGDVIWASQLKYHFSWDWLMPVVEKINTLPINIYHKYVVEIKGTFCTIQNNNSSPPATMFIKHGNTAIEAVYDVVIKFITWYNSLNQNKS